MNVEVQIQNGSVGMNPAVLDGLTLETERKGMPGKLTLSVLGTGLNVEEGNPIKLLVDGVALFYGFIFKITRDKSNVVKLMAYDQMRYLKNKDTYVFKNTTASRIVSMLAKDFGLTTGEVEETAYIIPSLVEDNKSLMDMMQEAIEITLTNTKKLYVLYDDAGKLTLKQLGRMKIGLLIDADTAETFSYDSSIDEATYNKIKLLYEDAKTRERKVFTAEDGATQKKWGTLQFFETISENETSNAQTKANALLKLYNTKTKHLTIKNALGDVRVRAGSVIMVKLNLGDMSLNTFMVVNRCKHTFRENQHLMELVLQGGEFVA